MLNTDEVIIDVSQANGNVDLVQVMTDLAPRKLVGVIARLTRGAAVVDLEGMNAIRQANNLRLRYVMGYHFLTDESALRQADNFTGAMRQIGWPAVYGVCGWLDCENDGATGTPINDLVARDCLINLHARMDSAIGWYSDRSIGRRLLNNDPIFSDCPPWIAITDGDIEQQANDYGCCLVQYDQLHTMGAPDNHTVDVNAIVNRAVLDVMCGYTNSTMGGIFNMIIFAVPNDFYLWGGYHMVGLGGAPGVKDALTKAGVPVLDTTTSADAKLFYDRCVAKETEAAHTITGTISGTVA